MLIRNKKQHLSIVFNTPAFLRDLESSGCLEQLMAQYDVSFLVYKNVQLEQMKHLNNSISVYPQISKTRFLLYIISKGLLHFHKKRRFSRARHHRLYRSLVNTGRFSRKIILTCTLLGIHLPLGSLLKFFLRITCPNLYGGSPENTIILLYWGTEGLFTDDVIRNARKERMSVFALQGNWDNIASKSIQETPDYIGTWGEQSFLHLAIRQNIRLDRIFVTGTLRFEKYRNPINKTSAREKLGIPISSRILLFCGSGIPFHETSALQLLEEAFSNKKLPQDLIIMYRPHPGRLERRLTDKFTPSGENVIFAPDDDKETTSLEFYSLLLNAADGMISPYSTMTLEAAVHGLPVLGLGYHHEGHADFDWSLVAYELHCYMLHHSDWFVGCNTINQFIPNVSELLKKINTDSIAEEARAYSQFAARQGTKTATNRILSALKTIENGLPSDDSMKYIRKPNI